MERESLVLFSHPLFVRFLASRRGFVGTRFWGREEEEEEAKKKRRGSRADGVAEKLFSKVSPRATTHTKPLAARSLSLVPPAPHSLSLSSIFRNATFGFSPSRKQLFLLYDDAFLRNDDAACSEARGADRRRRRPQGTDGRCSRVGELRCIGEINLSLSCSLSRCALLRRLSPSSELPRRALSKGGNAMPVARTGVTRKRGAIS